MQHLHCSFQHSVKFVTSQRSGLKNARLCFAVFFSELEFCPHIKMFLSILETQFYSSNGQFCEFQWSQVNNFVNVCVCVVCDSVNMLHCVFIYLFFLNLKKTLNYSFSDFSQIQVSEKGILLPSLIFSPECRF